MLFALSGVVVAQDRASNDPEVLALVQAFGDAKARSRAAFELVARGAAAVPAPTAVLPEPKLRVPGSSAKPSRLWPGSASTMRCGNG